MTAHTPDTAPAPSGAAGAALPQAGQASAASARPALRAKTPDAAPLARPVGADLFRVLAVFLVGWFHLWQQSWRSPGVWEPVVRTGYVWVDAMILLSAFCLFLPYAHARAAGQRFAGCRGFYKKRAARILPGYYLNLAAAAAAALAGGVLPDKAFGWDLFSHLTLTHTLCPYGYPHTRLNGVTWTLGVLAGFYLLFPLLARAFYARPAAVFLLLLGVQGGYSAWALGCLDENTYPAAFNQLPGFAGVLALGMAGALWLAKSGPALLKKGRGRLAGLCMAAAAFWGIFQMQARLAQVTENQRWQLTFRMPLALLFCLFLLGLCLLQPPAGRLWAFLGRLSYPFYLWHQVLAVWLKYLWRIPPWQGDTPPNQLGDAAWSLQYELLCWAAALAVSLAVYFLLERPLAARRRRR